MPCSRGSSQPRDRTRVSCGSCIAGGFFPAEPRGRCRLNVSKTHIETLPSRLVMVFEGGPHDEINALKNIWRELASLSVFLHVRLQ